MQYGVPESYVYELDEIWDAESLLLDRVTYEGSRPRGHWATPSSPTAVRPHLHVHTFADRFTAQRAQAAGLSRSPRSGATSGEGRG
jgi:hypothetical protein